MDPSDVSLPNSVVCSKYRSTPAIINCGAAISRRFLFLRDGVLYWVACFQLWRSSFNAVDKYLWTRSPGSKSDSTFRLSLAVNYMPGRPSTILVTGATGFIGAHCIDILLRDTEYNVRLAVRSQSKVDALLAHRKAYTGRMSYCIVKDVAAEGAFDEAVKGVYGILHLASPFTYDVANTEEELLKPAINGTLSVLKSALKEASIRRVVITSSVAAVINFSLGAAPGIAYGPADWNPVQYADGIHAPAVYFPLLILNVAELTYFFEASCIQGF